MSFTADVSRVYPAPVAGVRIIHSIGKQHFEPHWHDGYSFGILDQGGQKWRSRVGHVRGRAGQVINSNPGEVHDGSPDGDWREWRMITMDVGTMESLADGAGEIAPPVIDDPGLAARIRQALAHASSWDTSGRDAAFSLAVEEALVDVCTTLMSRYGGVRRVPATRSSKVAAVRERLADGAACPPSLADLAALTGLSRFQVLRSFKKAYGLPPHAWLISCRAERARSYIVGGMSLSKVAATVGFADQSHMTRTFVRLFGYTPGAWRRAAATPMQRRRSA
jgi:AraC-like DNA-binding protein